VITAGKHFLLYLAEAGEDASILDEDTGDWFPEWME
jgi:hypothetical protein